MKTNNKKPPEFCPFCKSNPCMSKHCPYTEEYEAYRRWESEIYETDTVLTVDHLNGLFELLEKK